MYIFCFRFLYIYWLCMILQLIKAIINSHIFISLLSILMVYRTSRVFNINIQAHQYSLVFLCTIFVYCIHSIFTEEKVSTDRVRWNAKRKPLFFLLTGISGFFLSLLIYQYPINVLYLLPAGIPTFYYTLSRIPQKYFTFKKVYFKTLNLTWVWVYVTAIFPVLISGRILFSGDTLSFFALEFVYIYLICFYFDHRDLLDDPQHYIFFNPHLHVAGVLKFISLMFFIAFISAFSYGLANGYLSSKLLLFFILLSFSKKSLTSKSEWLFYCYLDGMMAADLLGVLLFKSFYTTKL